AVDLHAAVDQGAGTVIGANGDGELELGHVERMFRVRVRRGVLGESRCDGKVLSGTRHSAAPPSSVMAGLVPAIHVFLAPESKTWMPGTRPGMTS
ncbi:MAG: hypothetical protein ACTHLO_06280, partial [Pseudolabrys sp.]